MPLLTKRSFQTALRYPERIALQQGQRRISYRDLHARSNRLAHVLTAYGVRRGDRVAIFSENRTEYVELQLAGAKLGVIVACQNWRMAPSELVHCLSLIEPKVTLVSERYADHLRALDCNVGKIVAFGLHQIVHVDLFVHSPIPL